MLHWSSHKLTKSTLPIASSRIDNEKCAALTSQCLPSQLCGKGSRFSKEDPSTGWGTVNDYAQMLIVSILWGCIPTFILPTIQGVTEDGSVNSSDSNFSVKTGNEMDVLLKRRCSLSLAAFSVRIINQIEQP